MSPAFLKNNADMVAAAKRCIELRQFLPALILMYSHIDTLAWAGSAKQKQSVRRNFESWVSRWLLPELSAKVPALTATDLYAARCGVLHSLTSKSDLSAAGVAKEMAYAWGTADALLLNSAIASTAYSNKLVTLHYNELHTSLTGAIAKFMKSTDSDSALLARLEEAAGKHYVSVPAAE